MDALNQEASRSQAPRLEPREAGNGGEPPPGALRPEVDDAARRARDRRRRLAARVRQALLLGVVLAAAVGVALALRPRPVPVDVAQAARGSLVVAIEETGIARVRDRYVVSAPVSGAVSRQLLEPGDAVAERQVIAEIAPVAAPLLDARTRAEAQVRLGAAESALGLAEAQRGRAAAAEALARDELAHARALAAGGSLAAQQLDRAEFEARMRGEERASAEFAVKVAAEQVRLARASLAAGGATPGRGGHVDVEAPASGRVLKVLQESEGVVAAGAPLVEVGNPEVLEVVVDLLTTDAVRVRPGTPVTIQGWGGDGALAARVRRVEPSAFTKLSALGVEEQRVNVIAALAGPPDAWSALGDGFRIEARLVLWRGDDVLKVPQGAAFRRGDGWAAFRVVSGKARLTPVEIGHRGETEVEVVGGLDPGAVVVVHPGDRVKDGAAVKAVE